MKNSVSYKKTDNSTKSGKQYRIKMRNLTEIEIIKKIIKQILDLKNE